MSLNCRQCKICDFDTFKLGARKNLKESSIQAEGQFLWLNTS